MSEYGVLVAVGPTGVRDGVLTFAAAEARRRGTGIELLHVAPSRVKVPASDEDMQRLDSALTEVGRTVLTEAAEKLRERVGDDVPIATEIRTGSVAATIVDRAADREIVVLQRRESTAERLLTMSISTKVAARARVPVAIVPQTWISHLGDDLPVVVGVDTTAEPLGQIEGALEHARDTGRRLDVLHAVCLTEPWQDMVFGRDSRDAWVREADQELAVALSKLPDTAVEIVRDVTWRRPVDALVGASRRAAVVVLNRREDHRLTPTLGSTTRAVLRDAHGPVLVVDRGHS